MGEGPIVYFTTDGRQVEVALSDVVFRLGTATLRNGPVDDALSKWLAYLAKDGRLKPGEPASPPPPAALLVKAAAPGSTGNGITVTVAPNSNDPTKVDVIVEEADVYESLTLDTIGKTLGATTTATPPSIAGTKPGLLRVKQFDPPPAPAEDTETPADDADTATDDTDALDDDVPPAPIPTNNQTPKPTQGTNPPEWTVEGGGNPLFTLVARGKLDRPDLITVLVKDVNTIDDTTMFTLEVCFRAVVTIGPADLARPPGDVFAAVALVATFSPPADSAWKLPVLGRVPLAGGTEPAEAASASATLRASD